MLREIIVMNEEKLVALLVYASFKRTATSSHRRISVAISSVSQSHSSSAQIKSEYGVTPYSVQHLAIAEWLDYLWRHQTSSDGTSTEQIFTLGVFHAVISHAVQLVQVLKSTFLTSIYSSQSK